MGVIGEKLEGLEPARRVTSPTMAIDVRVATPDDLEALVSLDFRNFGAVPEEGDVDEVRKELDLNRFLIAFDGDRPVAAGGSYPMELSLPSTGGQACPTVPMSGVTWVSVSATHRRQGILRLLMAGLDDLSAGFGEPALALTASEGGIYERFGYGVSTSVRCIEIDRRNAQIDPRWAPEPVELIEAADAQDKLFALWERFRSTQPGEVGRPAELHRIFTTDRKKPVYGALHPDGYVLYEIEPKWNEGHPAHRLLVRELVAATPQAHLALWNLLLTVDLVGPISGRRAASLDDPLPYFLTNPRALRTTDLNDGLWVKVTDAVRCFGERRYRAGSGDDTFTIAVTEDDVDEPATETFTVSVAGSQAECTPSDDEPDLVATRAALGPILLGVPATSLARGGRVRGGGAALDRADILFGSERPAHCRTPF
jgi:predicted acetyltransferase